MRKIGRILAFLYIGYLALVLLVVNPALNYVPALYVKQLLDRELITEIILFNPFTFNLEVRKAELPEHSGERFIGFDKAAVNLSLASIWQRGWVFDKVELKGLFVHARQLPDGVYNFSDLLPPDKDDQTVSEPLVIPAVTINDLDLHSQRIQISNESRAKPISTHWDSLAIRVSGLSTVAEEGRPYSIDARGQGGGSLRWEGELSLPRASGSGYLALSDIYLPNAWRFIEPWVDFELVNGRLSVAGRYAINWREAFSYTVSEGEIALSEIAIAPKVPADLPDTAVQLASFSLKGIELDGPARHVELAEVAVDGLEVSGWSEGTNVSLIEMFQMNFPEQENAPAAQINKNTADPEVEWTATVETINLRAGVLRWNSEFTDPALLNVTPIELSIDKLQWPFSGASAVSLGLKINDEVAVDVSGELELASGTGNFDYQLQSLPLAWFNPNFPQALKARISKGQLQLEGSVGLAQYEPVRLGMNGAMTDFSGGLQGTAQSLTSWDAIRWEELLVDFDNREVQLAKLSINNYAGRLHIRKDGSINAQNLWADEEGQTQSEEASAQSVGESSSAAIEPEAPWSVSIPVIAVTDSQIDFMDESLPIQFRTVIGELDGDILGISSTPGAVAQVDMAGSVDGYAPVKLSGTAEPLASAPALDLELSFSGVDLALLTPYSSTYAGYAIDRGLLNLNLQYTLKDDLLQGHNKVLIDQLKLGDKVESDQAIDLPLNLALALLTDSNGVIDMEVPVSGSLGDPQFSIGSVVFGAFVNLITKAVTAPFSLLANLVGSDEDLQRLSFSTGSSELNTAGIAKLTQLSNAMAQRPELGLVVTGRLQPEADRERLQKTILKSQLNEAGLSVQDIQSKGLAWDKAIAARYESLGISNETPPTLREQYLQLAKAISVPDAALLELAQNRAIAVKTYLVNEAQLDAARIAIEQTHMDDKGNLFSGVEMGVDI